MLGRVLTLTFTIQLFLTCSVQASPQNGSSSPSIERGRYLSTLSGCNDCHTSGFAQSNGKVPEHDWLKGDSVGFRGPWGTTYPINLRLYFAGISEDQWVTLARSFQSRPPMPSYVLNMMEENDLRSIYQFITSLGKAGIPAPGYVSPDQEPNSLYIVFEPVGKSDGQVKAIQ